MKKFTTVICLGPGIDMSPFITNKSPKFMLPILNECLLNINIKWIQPISSKILIIVLEQYKDFIDNAIKTDEIKIITVKDYDGTFVVLKSIKEELGEDILLYKGDFVTDMDANIIAQEYTDDVNFLAVFGDKGIQSELIVHDGPSLLYYGLINGKSSGIRYALMNEHDNCYFKLGLEPLQFYIFKKEILNFDFVGYSFKSIIFPQIINYCRKSKPVKMFVPRVKIHQINSFNEYTSINYAMKLEAQFSKWTLGSTDQRSEFKSSTKKRVSFEDGKDFKKTIVGANFEIKEGTDILDTIIGNNVSIGANTRIIKSIIMDGVKIGSNCIIENCLIGFSVVIIDDSELKECKIPANYIFLENIKISKKNFIIQEDYEN